MVYYTENGGVVPNHVKRRGEQAGDSSSYSMFGLYYGTIIKAVYPEDSDNKSGRMEYVVAIDGRRFYGVQELVHAGSIFNNHFRLRKEADVVEPADIGEVGDAAFVSEAKKNGERVWILFARGHGDYPVIIGSIRHPLLEEKNDEVSKPSASDNIVERYENVGFEFVLGKDGSYTIKNIGEKEHKSGMPIWTKNEDGVGSTLKCDKDGKWSVSHKDTTVEIDGVGGNVLLKVEDTSIEIKDKSIVVKEDGGSALNLVNGKVSLTGNSDVTGNSDELLTLFEEALAQMSLVYQACAGIIVNTAVGPSSVPTNASAFTTAKDAIDDIKTRLGEIKL